MLAGSTKVDAITGDWLSEFNLGTRGMQKQDISKAGYEPGFLISMRMAIKEYLAYPRDLKIAVNAGGLNPKQLAIDLQKLIESNGGSKKIAYITGDNVVDRIDSLDIKPLTRSTGDFALWKQKHGRILTANVVCDCGITIHIRDLSEFMLITRQFSVHRLLGSRSSPE